MLCDFLNFDATTPHGEILMKMYFQNLKFAVEKRFTTEKTSTLFSVLKLVHFTSMGEMTHCLTRLALSIAV